MRIGLPATRSLPCLDARRCGFAMMGESERVFRRFGCPEDSGGFAGDWSRRVSDMAAPATASISSRPVVSSLVWTSLRVGDGEREIGAVAGARVCDWALLTRARLLRGVDTMSGGCGTAPRKGCPPEGTRSAAPADRHAQRSEHGAVGLAASAAGQPGREAMRHHHCHHRHHRISEKRPRPATGDSPCRQDGRRLEGPAEPGRASASTRSGEAASSARGLRQRDEVLEEARSSGRDQLVRSLRGTCSFSASVRNLQRSVSGSSAIRST